MLAKLLRSSVSRTSSLKQQARLRELREYMCVREAMDKQASEKASADFKALCDKHKLTPKELSELFAILGTDYKNLHKYFTTGIVANEQEDVETKWRDSSFFKSDQTFQKSYDELKSKYSDILLFHESQPLRKKAMDEVAVIFSTGVKNFSPGYADIQKNYNAIDKHMIAQAAALRGEGPKPAVAESHTGASVQRDLNEQAIDLLHSIFKKLISNPQETFGHLVRHYQVYYPSGTKALAELGFTLSPADKKQLQEVIEDAELQGLINDLNDFNFTPASYTNSPWIDDKKTIFEAFVSHSKDSRIYNLIALLCLAGIIYKVYQGDATIVQYLLLGGIAAYSRHTARLSGLRYKTAYIGEIQLHKGGQHIDLLIRKNGKWKTVNDVKISEFKIHRGNSQVKNATVDHLRANNVGTDAWLATWGNSHAFVPFKHLGSNTILENVFSGKALPQKLLQ